MHSMWGIHEKSTKRGLTSWSRLVHKLQNSTFNSLRSTIFPCVFFILPLWFGFKNFSYSCKYSRGVITIAKLRKISQISSKSQGPT